MHLPSFHLTSHSNSPRITYNQKNNVDHAAGKGSGLLKQGFDDAFPVPRARADLDPLSY